MDGPRPDRRGHRGRLLIEATSAPRGPYAGRSRPGVGLHRRHVLPGQAGYFPDLCLHERLLRTAQRGGAEAQAVHRAVLPGASGRPGPSGGWPALRLLRPSGTSPLVRTHLSLFSAESILNFRPAGETFVPAAGVTIVCLLFLPMASVRSERRLLAVHADDPGITLSFARRYLENNRRLIALQLPQERQAVHPQDDLPPA